MPSEPTLLYGPRGERLYPSAREAPAKFRNLGSLPRDMRQAVKPVDWAEMVTLAAKLAAGDGGLMGAIRQRSEWAFAGDSWQPIFYGEDEEWGDIATDWLTHQVFPHAVRCNVRTDLIKAMQVSAATGWTVHGGDLALFSVDANKMPKMTLIPGTRIGNGSRDVWNSTVTGGSYSQGSYTLTGMATCVGGRYDGFRIYNGFIYDDADEIVAVRVEGLRREGNTFVPHHIDFTLGFERGAHFASEYDWHGMGRPLPKFAASLLRIQQKYQTDDNFFKAIDLASQRTLLHKLAPGQDVTQSRGNSLTEINVPAYQSASGEEETLHVEFSRAGDITYIASDEDLVSANFANPHPNVEEFVRRIRSECLLDLGWPYELTDLSSTGRAPTRLSCELANNSMWGTQCTGETRLFWFVKFAIAQGITHGHIPSPRKSAPLDDPYRWTFGFPKEMSVDAGNDVTASLNRLRYGLTSQRVESARWGYVLKRIRRDRQKEIKALIDDASEAAAYAKTKGHDLPFVKAMELFWQPSANAASLPNTAAETAAQPDKTSKPDKTNNGE